MSPTTSYSLEISLSIMELQGPEFLITRAFLLRAWTLMLLPGICAKSLFAAMIPYTDTFGFYFYISFGVSDPVMIDFNRLPYTEFTCTGFPYICKP